MHQDRRACPHRVRHRIRPRLRRRRRLPASVAATAVLEPGAASNASPLECDRAEAGVEAGRRDRDRRRFGCRRVLVAPQLPQQRRPGAVPADGERARAERCGEVADVDRLTEPRVGEHRQQAQANRARPRARSCAPARRWPPRPRDRRPLPALPVPRRGWTNVGQRPWSAATSASHAIEARAASSPARADAGRAWSTVARQSMPAWLDRFAGTVADEGASASSTSNGSS